MIRWVIGFVFLYGLWLVLSGMFILEFLILGALASALVATLTYHLTFPSRAERMEPFPHSRFGLVLIFLRFLAYIPWLLFQIAIANLQVTYQILHPRMPVSPRLLHFHTTLRTEPSQILLAQSITLTPGTITVDLDQCEFLVHSLAGGPGQILDEGGIQQRVARVFGEPSHPIPTSRTFTSIDELHQ
jgi:multicomponent Na+:H+ antiporter subunit E